jgi:hypothetical protein
MDRANGLQFNFAFLDFTVYNSAVSVICRLLLEACWC